MLKKTWIILLLAVLLLSACSEEGFVYRFETDDEADWKFEDEADVKRYISDGVYTMELYDSGVNAWENPGLNLSNPTITALIADTGVAMDGSYGLMCNFQDELNHYIAGFGSDQTFFIMKTQAGVDTLLLGNADGSYLISDKIDPFAEVYEVKLSCVDGVISLSVDGNELGSVQDDTFGSGDVGFFAVSFQQVPLVVEFDNLLIAGEVVGAETEATE